MSKFLSIVGITVLFIFGITALIFSQTGTQSEQLTITTYYPSPYGSYNELQLYPHKDSTTQCNADTQGTMYYYLNRSDPSDSKNNKVLVCNGTGWVELSVGGASSGPLSSGPLKIGWVDDAYCDGAAKAGTIRYNGTNKTYQYCDGATWKDFGSTGVYRPPVVFTDSGTFTVPLGVTRIRVQGWGGGGGGGIRGGATAFTGVLVGNGGGGGGYGEHVFSSLKEGDRFSVVVGLGGEQFSDGGSSSFGNITFGGGGKGGPGSANSILFYPGSGGSSNAQITVRGGTGSISTSAEGGKGGDGGSSGGAGGAGATNGRNAEDGIIPGGGGGGAWCIGNPNSDCTGTLYKASKGARGQIIVHFI